MSVTVQLPTVLARHAGSRTLELEGRTVGEVVAAAASRWPELGPRLRDADGRPYRYVSFYLNDEDIRFRGGFGAPVADGDELIIVPAIAGG
jgi:molybdopterin synthase sulfur carrier subunit